MSRIAVTDPKIAPLVTELVSLFRAEGSVHAMYRTLARNLGDTAEANRIYPNRIHALLSQDSTRAVNEQTIENLREALAGLDKAEIASSPRAKELSQKILSTSDRLRAVNGSPPHDDFVTHLAERLQIPRGVVGLTLAQAGHLGPAVYVAKESAPPVWKHKPDWSFQDDAYRATLDALRRDPNRKVGLVLPTGGGKTRTAVRVALRCLADSDRSDSVVLWVTHRRFLRTQVTRELQRAMAVGTKGLPSDAAKLLGHRLLIVMVSELGPQLSELADRVALVVVDEAHRAAAPSYAPMFAVRPLRGLFLTATPNRTDQKAIGIDEIAYTITYRELFRRGVLVDPTFEPPLVLSSRAWESEDEISDVCDYILDRSRDEFSKTIVVASRVDHVLTLYRLLVAQLEACDDHILTTDEIGYVHGSGSSTGSTPDAYLDEFCAFERGILVATAQMLGEGFDDPKINAVVMTYPTSSMLQLMQVAGRGLRYAPNKPRAFIVQARESDLAYHFEQRWLYQDISDTLRPRLIDAVYGSKADLIAQITKLLDQRSLSSSARALVLAQLHDIVEGEEVSLLVTGLPYAGAPTDFDDAAEWHAVAVTSPTRRLFLSIFNDFSQLAGDVRATEFLRDYVEPSLNPASPWMRYRDVLTAMEYARRELRGEFYSDSASRPYAPNRGTTWLSYATFRFKPSVPSDLSEFLADAVNRTAVLAEYVARPERWFLCIKLEFPLGGTFAYLFSEDQYRWVAQERQQLQRTMTDVEIDRVFSEAGVWRSGHSATPIPQTVVDRFESIVAERGWLERALELQPLVDHGQSRRVFNRSG